MRIPDGMVDRFRSDMGNNPDAVRVRVRNCGKTILTCPIDEWDARQHSIDLMPGPVRLELLNGAGEPMASRQVTILDADESDAGALTVNGEGQRPASLQYVADKAAEAATVGHLSRTIAEQSRTIQLLARDTMEQVRLLATSIVQAVEQSRANAVAMALEAVKETGVAQAESAANEVAAELADRGPFADLRDTVVAIVELLQERKAQIAATPAPVGDAPPADGSGFGGDTDAAA